MTREQLWEQFSSLSEEAQGEVVDFMAFLRQKETAKLMRRKRVSMDFEKQPFIGMWKDREDMKDSTQWVRSLRRSQ